MQKITFIIFLFLFFSHDTCHVFADTNKTLSEISKFSDSFINYVERHSKAKNDGFLPTFSDTKSSIKNKMNDILDDVLEVLSDNDENILSKKRQIVSYMQKNEELKKEISELEFERLVAPTDKPFYKIFSNTTGDINTKIDDMNKTIDRNLNLISKIKLDIQFGLKKNGVNLTENYIDSLVNTVTGDDMITAIIVLKTIQDITIKLKELLNAENENIYTAKKFYGVYLASISSYCYLLSKYIDKIDNVYIQKLQTIRSDNNKLMDITKSQIRKSDSKDERLSYTSNLKAQQITEKTIDVYYDILLKQKTQLENRLLTTNRLKEIAENGYFTVTIAHSLYEIIVSNESIYNSLMSISMLDPVTFENKDMEAKYFELTKRLAAD
jgi:hypothetical protein